MELKKLLAYVKENARDVADLGIVASIERIEQGDPYRKVLIGTLREKYEGEAETEEIRQELFADWGL